MNGPWEYRRGRWYVYKPFGWGQPGFKMKRVLFVWRWWAWPHENAGRADWFVAKGWAFRERHARWAAHRVAWLAWPGADLRFANASQTDAQEGDS